MTSSEIAGPLRDERDIPAGRAQAFDLTPALAAICYPLLLDAFHSVVGPPETRLAASAVVAAAAMLACILAVPALGLVFATREHVGTSARRLAYACVVAPTVYVFLGVVQAMAGSILPDELVWCVFWSGAALWVWSRPYGSAARPAPAIGRWRVVHGITGAIVLLYVGFHIINHLFGLIGPDAHAAVMDLGRKVYRAPFIEPLLVALMLFQVASGLYLAWRWSVTALDFQKTFQVASGVYLSVFILGHMNSVFLYARTYLGIPTGWAFATGAPTGLIHDAWNIRLLPHYLLGIFFVLAHLSSGLRGVLIAHGTNRRTADRLWLACASASAVIATAIIVGMCGGRIAAP
ncbi:hypothetical protein [uncultured Sphingomonas sp.]|uniref:hypothetical protein n=1 Tax=uncultured Sphingomonas sp. TaxID=158754 RepID=UPI0035CB06BD